MMRSRPRSAPRKTSARVAMMVAQIARYSPFGFLILGFFLVTSSALAPQLWQGPRTAATDLVSPIVSTLSRPFQFVADGIGGMTGINDLRAENDRLKSENDRLREWYQTALLLQAENKSLKDLLNVMPEPSQSYITARVIGDSGSPFVKSLLLTAGSQDGIEDGQAVLGGQGMIGRVIETGRKASRILLLNDINSRVPVVILGSNVKAILAGNNENILDLEHVPPDTLIKSNDAVTTSGHGGLFPQGLPIGQIVKKEDGTLGVRLYSDPASVSYVQIVEKPEDVNTRRSIQTLTTPSSSFEEDGN
jgi:rod shape-determining protein MreC